MPRSWFGGTSADQVVTKYHFGSSATLTAIAVGKRVTFWDDEDLGARHTDLLIDGTVPADSVVADDFGYLPRLQGPDGVTVMWADMGDATPRRLFVTTDGAIAAAADLANKIDTVEKGAMGGVAELGPTGKIVQPVPAAVIEDVIDQANLPAHLDPADLDATYVAGEHAKVYVDRQAGATDRDKLIAALTGATALGGTVALPDRTIDVGAGLSLSGYSCSIEGRGAGYDISTGPSRSVIHASTQAGPVLDFDGFKWPDSFRGRLSIGGFAIEGSGVADPTKANSGMRVATPTLAAGSAHFHDIGISATGGPCLDLGAVYLSDFERITLVTPVGAKVNDVPYLNIVGANGNRFVGLGFRSMTSSDDTGVSGALKIRDTGTYAPHDNLFLGTWFEFLHVPNGGALVDAAGNMSVFSDTQFFDCSKESGATGTAFYRLRDATVGNSGGNLIRGYIPGRSTSAAAIDTGVDLLQSRNRVGGVKGYRGYNVTIGAGVNNSHITLGGAESGATDPAVVDNSGVLTNVYADNYLRTERAGSYDRATRTSGDGGAGPRFSDPGTPANGAVWLGTSNARIQAVGVNAHITSDTVTLRGIALDTTKQFVIDTSFRPGIQFGSHGALPTAAVGLRGKLVYVQGAAGVADQMYVCRKNAADAYEWAQITV